MDQDKEMEEVEEYCDTTVEVPDSYAHDAPYVELHDEWWFVNKKTNEIIWSFERQDLLGYLEKLAKVENPQARTSAFFDHVYSENDVVSITRPPANSKLKVAVVFFKDNTLAIFPLFREILQDFTLHRDPPVSNNEKCINE